MSKNIFILSLTLFFLVGTNFALANHCAGGHDNAKESSVESTTKETKETNETKDKPKS